jgi:excisionase family DNA binding protein
MSVAEKTRLVTLPEAADRLGVKVNTIRAWIYRRSVPYTKVGRAVRISDETIDKLIEQGTVPALKR